MQIKDFVITFPKSTKIKLAKRLMFVPTNDVRGTSAKIGAKN